MVPRMVKVRKTYQGAPGFIGVLPAMPKGGVRLATGYGSRVMLNA